MRSATIWRACWMTERGLIGTGHLGTESTDYSPKRVDGPHGTHLTFELLSSFLRST
jgi:hypothetical protein